MKTCKIEGGKVILFSREGGFKGGGGGGDFFQGGDVQGLK